MSYSFQVRKTETTLEIVDHPGQMEGLLKQIPDGSLFIINGHTPSADTSSIGFIAISQLIAKEGEPQKLIGAANGQYNTDTEET